MTKVFIFVHVIFAEVTRATRMLGLIKRSYTFLDKWSLLCLYKAMVGPILIVWSPYRKGDIDAVESERVQRRATRILPELRGLDYEAKLLSLKLPTLTYRRLRGDVINMYKYIHGIYIIPLADNMLAQYGATRGQYFKLYKHHSRLNLRKHIFSQRTVDVWNSLPDDVATSPSLNILKHRIYYHWRNEIFLYEYKGRLTRPICDLVVGRQVTAVDARHKLTRCLHDRHRQGQAIQLT